MENRGFLKRSQLLDIIPIEFLHSSMPSLSQPADYGSHSNTLQKRGGAILIAGRIGRDAQPYVATLRPLECRLSHPLCMIFLNQLTWFWIYSNFLVQGAISKSLELIDNELYLFRCHFPAKIFRHRYFQDSWRHPCSGGSACALWNTKSAPPLSD